MNIEGKAGIRNEYRIVVEDIKTGEVQEHKAYNLVLNQMWTRLVNFQAYFVNIHFGTGTGTLSPTRTSLFSHLGTKAAVNEAQTRALPTSVWTRRIVLNPEEFVGQTLTEVGVAFGATASNLVTHAFIEDAEGNPISLTKTDTQIVTIYATIYITLSADSAYGDKVRLVQPLTNNEWLSYLLGGSYPTQQYRVTRAPNFNINGTAPAGISQGTNVLITDWIKDAANKRVVTPVRRLGVSTGNGEVRGFGLGSSNALGTFRGQFPIPTILTEYPISETIGTGDGATAGFNPLWANANISAVKIDDVTIDPLNYDLVATRRGTNAFSFKDVTWLAGVNPGNLHHLTDGDITSSVSVAFNSGAFGIDIGETLGAFQVDTFRVRTGAGGAQLQIRGSDNADFSGSMVIATVGGGSSNTWYSGSFSPVAYRYYRLAEVGYNPGIVAQVELLTADDQITFHTPPASGTITAEYKVPYIPKDQFRVVDFEWTLQYGEV